MRLHRFYISEPIGSQAEITIINPELINQIRRVFRLKVGDSVILFDGSGSDYECIIDEFSGESKIKGDNRSDRGSGPTSMRVHITTTKRSAFLPAREVILCAAIVKKDTFEWIVEKATELGVTKIIPIMAERSEKKNLNEDRLKKIAIEASEQSGRGTIPAIEKIMTLKEIIDVQAGPTCAEPYDHMLAFNIEGKLFEQDEQGLPSCGSPLFVFVGPEGGWSPDEIDMFHKNKVLVVSLGTQVLRAETAVVAALSLVLLGK